MARIEEKKPINVNTETSEKNLIEEVKMSEDKIQKHSTERVMNIQSKTPSRNEISGDPNVGLNKDNSEKKMEVLSTSTSSEKAFQKKNSIEDKRANPHTTEKKSAFGKISPKVNGMQSTK